MAAALLLLVALLGIGIWPRLTQARYQAEAVGTSDSRLRVVVVSVGPGPPTVELRLPGSIEAESDVAIHARADGYVRRRLVDIGDRVRAGQALAEIESPELVEQIHQSEAALQRAAASVRQADAALEQARAQRDLAEVTMKRWDALVSRGVLAQQDGDEKRATYRARQADVAAAEANAAGARDFLRSAESDLRRLRELQAFRRIEAPVDGVITARHVDVGTLVTAGSSSSVGPLFRLAASGRYRVRVRVPQSEAALIHAGQTCDVDVRDLPDRRFTGRVERTAGALDISSRTLPVEVSLESDDPALMPGMSAMVVMTLSRPAASLLIPATAFRTSSDGPRVAVVDRDNRVRFVTVRLGRDDGTRIEVLEGLAPGDRIVTSISDSLEEGVEVEAVEAAGGNGGSGSPRS